MRLYFRFLIVALSWGLVLNSVSLFQSSISHAKLETDSIKHILKKIFPPCGPGTRNQRFVVSKEGSSVCDNKTGLWWERSPSTDYFVWGLEWGIPNAVDHCDELNLEGKKWRLPTVEELITLLNFSVFTQAEALNQPNGPFVGLLPNSYWSATSYIGPADAWFVNFATGFVFSNSKEFKFHAWCIRGARDADAY